MQYEGLEIDEDDDGKWRWTWQSPGGAFYLGPYHHKTKGEATKAGRAWLREQLKEADT